jgi:hypothetical protein
MSTTVRRRPAVAIARAATAELAAMLGLPELDVARPGAVGLLGPPALLPTADGWVHPGPPTAWGDFAAMAQALGAPPPSPRHGPFPDLTGLAAEVVDREAGAWMLPAVAVRSGPAVPAKVPRVAGDARVHGARIVVVGFAWAAPLAGTVVRLLGAEVVRIVDPRRPDPFPLRAVLAAGQHEVALDLGDPAARARAAALLASADVLVDATTPRVLRNAGLADLTTTVHIAAFADDDRPGYGIAAEARGGWAARHDPPRLGRASVADPVAGLLAAMTVVEVLQRGRSDAPRVSLESAVGYLLAWERSHG